MTCVEMQEHEREEVARFIEKHWHGRDVVISGRRIFPHQQRGLIERRDGHIVGLLTYRTHDNEMELLTINSEMEGRGIGTQLMLAVMDIARREHRTRVWLTTTNDNLRVISFNQRLGFRMTAIHLNAVEKSREFKPTIPLHGERGIRIQDEIIMELHLQPYE